MRLLVEEDCDGCGGCGRSEGGYGGPCRNCDGAGLVRRAIALEEFAKLLTWGTCQTKDADDNWGTLNVIRVVRP